ncbi:EamA family transporter [Flavobacterium psychrotrophum]|uniref:EamA family transporter n=1 Tax=Flavobacterium psychrotrophum TaxID=2294119 RepID=UPI000E321B26|nr:DMT family transporter [Flavobacterium psychrotrophum]
MGNNNTLKGVILVGLGAASYGLLATFVKLAYAEGYTTAEVTASQMALGILSVSLINLFRKNKTTEATKATGKNKLYLMLAGTSTGFTSVFYYLGVKYIPVSVGIVLLMQSVWMGVLAEWMITKQPPTLKKILAVLVVLGGTVLATNLINADEMPDWRGIAWGMAAALSYTITMFAGNRIAVNLPAPKRSLFMLLGGAVVVLTFTAITWPGYFNFQILYTWGIPLSLFGTLLPPLFMNAGFPKVSMGLGSIVSAIELPVSVTMAYIFLHETVSNTQWAGITLILAAIVLMNISLKRKA